MLKFVVVIIGAHSRAISAASAEVHGRLVMKFPRLRKYAQNYPCPDSKRKHPGWDAIVEVCFDSWEAMEAAWASSQGAASDADLPAFADPSRTTWSVVEEITLLK